MIHRDHAVPPAASCSLLILLGVVIAGCDTGAERPEVFPVRGQLSINDQPAEGALLSLHPVDGQDFDQRGSRPWAEVQPDGSFVVSTYGEGDGAPAGDYAVSIVWLDNPDSANPEDRLGGRFAAPERSEWRVTIVEGDNVLEPRNIDRARLARPRRSAEDAIEPTE